ncbi:hypothetical protein D3C87_464360 [compost metagenome]
MIFLLAGVSCRKNRVHPVPSIAFEIQVDMNLPTYQELTNVGGWAYVNGGLKGIIIYRQSVDVFVAWERMSPEDPEMKCESGLVPDSTNFLRLNDPCSNAVFSMYDGSPIANSDWGLRQYRTEWGGSNLLRVYN